MGWEEEASCRDLDGDLFAISQLEDRDVGHLDLTGLDKWAKLSKFNKVKLTKAQKVCSLCPVRAECLESAELADKYWTVRGGELPKMYINQKVNRKRGAIPSARSERYLEYSCSNGGHAGDRHKGYRMTESRGKKYKTAYCITCDGEKQARYKANRDRKLAS